MQHAAFNHTGSNVAQTAPKHTQFNTQPQPQYDTLAFLSVGFYYKKPLAQDWTSITMMSEDWGYSISVQEIRSPVVWNPSVTPHHPFVILFGELIHFFVQT